MLEKYYSDYGIKKFLELNKNYQNNKNWFNKKITNEEIIQISNLERTEFCIEKLFRNAENQTNKEINLYIDKILSAGSVCAVGCGEGEKEYQLLINQTKKRVFFLSDIATYDNLSQLENYIKKTPNSKSFFTIKKSVKLNKIPFRKDYFDSYISGNLIQFLNNNELIDSMNEMKRVLKKGGVGIIWTTTFLNPLNKLILIFKKVMNKKSFYPLKNNLKHFGYIRDDNEFEKCLKSVKGLKLIEKKKILSNTKASSKKITILKNILPLKLYAYLNPSVCIFVIKKFE